MSVHTKIPIHNMLGPPNTRITDHVAEQAPNTLLCPPMSAVNNTWETCVNSVATKTAADLQDDVIERGAPKRKL
jgi:hypothetical protein